MATKEESGEGVLDMGSTSMGSTGLLTSTSKFRQPHLPHGFNCRFIRWQHQ
ncbi:MAG: hypothetical protein WC492_00650 [Candidatus Micrarchaeia archaeon]